MSTNESNLDIEKSPDLLQKPSIASGVKTLNKKPIMLIAGAVILLLIGLGYAASTRGKSNISAGEQAVEQEGKKGQEGKVQLATMVDDLEKRGSRFPEQNQSSNGDPLGQYTQPSSAVVGDPLTPQSPPAMVTNGQRQYNGGNGAKSDRERMIEEKLKLYAGAISSPTKIKVDGNNGFGGSGTAQGGFPQLGATGSTGALDGLVNVLNKAQAAAGQTTETDNDARNTPWLDKANKSYDYLAANKAKPKSPYEVKAGTVIPGVMITGINSELPGQILGVVSENVYDTGYGRHLLIPQGSKLIGIYSANVIFGQERVLVAWNRIVFPNAKTLNIGAMPGIDQAGYAGFSDQVNNHYMKIFGSAFMMSMITGGIAVSSNNNGNQMTQTPSDQMIAAMISQMGEVGKQMIQKNLNIAPTLEIRPGYRFNIFVTKDMILEPLRY